MKQSVTQILALKAAAAVAEYTGASVTLQKMKNGKDEWIHIEVTFANEQVLKQEASWMDARIWLKGFLAAAKHYDKPF